MPLKAQREFYIPRLEREKALHGNIFEIRLRNTFCQRTISQECAKWVREKARFKSNSTTDRIPGFLAIDGKEVVAYASISGFTRAELGCEQGRSLLSIINQIDAPESEAYLKAFDLLWNDQQRLQDVTDKVLDSIAAAYQENSPEFLYFFAMYNIFRDFLEQVNQDDLPNESVGFKQKPGLE